MFFTLANVEKKDKAWGTTQKVLKICQNM